MLVTCLISYVPDHLVVTHKSGAKSLPRLDNRHVSGVTRGKFPTSGDCGETKRCLFGPREGERYYLITGK